MKTSPAPRRFDPRLLRLLSRVASASDVRTWEDLYTKLKKEIAKESHGNQTAAR